MAALENCRSMIAILLISWGLAASAVIGSLVIAAGVPIPPLEDVESAVNDQTSESTWDRYDIRERRQSVREEMADAEEP